MNRSSFFLREGFRILAPLAIIALGVGGLWVFGQKPAPPKRIPSGDVVSLVETVVAEASNGAMVIEVEGVATPFRRVTLSAEVAGRITEKDPLSRAGNYLHEGDFLLQIDETDYVLESERLTRQLEEAQEELAAADINIANTESLIELAIDDLALRKKELVRFQDLAKRSAISQREVDEASRLELASQVSLQTLRNELASQRQRIKTLTSIQARVVVQKSRAEIDRERTRISSPLAGTVISDLVEENDYVKKGDPLIVINGTRRMEVKCNLRVDELYWIWLQAGVFQPDTAQTPDMRYGLPKTPVQVVYEFGGMKHVWEGELWRFEGTGVDADTRTIPCRVLIPEPTHVRLAENAPSSRLLALPRMVSGMYVTIKIPVKSPIPLLRLPANAVHPGGRVWVAKKGRLQIKTIEIARSDDHSIFVRRLDGAGVQPGDHLVVSPLPNAHDGMLIEEAGK